MKKKRVILRCARKLCCGDGADDCFSTPTHTHKYKGKNKRAKNTLKNTNTK